MKVYLAPPQPSLGLYRISTALVRHAPAGVEITSNQAGADLTVIYAIGRRDHIQRQVEDILSRDRQYAVVQVCLRSTLSPKTDDWLELWQRARVVWSYYDLQRACFSDGNFGTWAPSVESINFLHAPLGVDSQVFQPHPNWDNRQEYVVLSSGQSRLSESVRECHLAAQLIGRHSAHLGKLRLVQVDCYYDMPDETLRGLYNHCEFVSGLRRTEGFELPAAEGLLCGARPVVFDTPDYRWNYKGWAEYIHEGTRAEVVDQLVQLFKQGARPVTASEREEAAHWFNWERVCGEFWARCLR